jgi:hypothetical protein
MSADNRQPAFPFRPKEKHRSYRFNEGSDTWDFNVANRKFSECLPAVDEIMREFERIEAATNLAIVERGDLATLIIWASAAMPYSADGYVVERFVAIVDYLCYVAEIYINNGHDALATIDPKPYKIIENELIVPITTRSFSLHLKR